LHTGKFLLAIDVAGLAGCIYLELRGERGYFGYLAVEPSRQRSGVGRRLVLAGEDYLRSQRCRFSDMRIVNLRAELPEFYRRLGYSEVSTEPFSGEGEPRLACHFVNFSKLL
jgi:GNAT superfamily N-acetyltransferase